MKAIYLLNSDAYVKIYGQAERDAISTLVDVIAPPQTATSVRENPSVLAGVEAIFSGWGMAQLDEDFLSAAPELDVVFYGAGSIRYFATETAWERGITICSAWAANAVPVAEFTLAQIILGLKRVWHHALAIKHALSWIDKVPVPGAYGSTVGLISLGMIGRMVAERLRALDVHVIAYDPYVSAANAAALGVRLVPLDTVFSEADVVSLHTPNLPETRGMITGAHLASMKEGATFINTARGAVVREQEMIEVLGARPDLYAVLDVTDPEPPVEGSPLYTFPNVILTPHIAGSMDGECRRMGQYMVDECRRYLAGEPLRWSIDRERAKTLA